MTCLVLNLQSQIFFEDTAPEHGVAHTIHEWTIGAGISLYDFNQDGLDDLTLGTELDWPVKFFVNTGSGFELIEPLIDNTSEIKQVLWVDFDNDGDPDLHLSSFYGVNRLYENRGNLNLVDITEDALLPLDEAPSYGACWGDYNRDGWLDLYTSARGLPGEATSHLNNRLFENNADGTFKEVSIEKNVNDPGKLPFCASFLDFNNDMWPDIYIANDKLTFNTMFQNIKGFYFEDVSAITRTNMRMNAMCVTTGDYNNDGWTDIYVTNTPVGNKLLTNAQYKNGPEVSYFDYTNKENVGFYGNGWGSNFIDADNDGDLDLYVSGSIDGSDGISSLFYENTGDLGFVNTKNHGFSGDTTHSFVNAIGDINNDGLLDIVVQNNAPYQTNIWENMSTNSGHWLKLDLQGVLSNREGIGARIELFDENFYQSFYTVSGTGFLGQNSRKIHAGLGNRQIIDSIRITWPTGHIDRFEEVEANQILKIEEGQTTNGRIDVNDDVELKFPQQTTSIVELDDADQYYTISPNPVQSHLRIHSKKPNNSPTYMAVYSMDGQRLITRRITSFPLELEMSDLQTGVHLIYLSDGKTRSLKKILKI